MAHYVDEDEDSDGLLHLSLMNGYGLEFQASFCLTTRGYPNKIGKLEGTTSIRI